MARTTHGLTIQDVARAAAVSSTSISNYLNGRMNEMRPETRLRIAKAIKELGFTPNAAARQLKTGNSPILGLLVPSVVNPYFGELAAAIEVAAEREGYRVVLCNTQREPRRELAFVRELVAYGVRGILSTTLLQDKQVMNRLVEQGVAFVFLEPLGDSPGIDRVDVVSTNNTLALEKAVDFLVELGHTSIAYATATPLTPHRMSRVQGFRNAVARQRVNEGLVITDQDIPGQPETLNDADLARFGHLAAAHIIRIPQATRPTAVIAMNDLVALAMMFAFLEKGVRIPGDISVVGFDDIQLSRFTYPTLTTVRQPYAEIAEAAIDRVLARLADPTRPGATIALDPALVARASSAAFQAREPVSLMDSHDD